MCELMFRTWLLAFVAGFLLSAGVSYQEHLIFNCEPNTRVFLINILPSAQSAGFTQILSNRVRPVCGIEIYTSRELEAVNGTNVKLKCTFNSPDPVSQYVTVSWTFRPLSGGADESVFYYQGHPYPPTTGRFKGQVEWSGDVLKKDASITLQNVPPTFNGTYICQVRNPPDVHGVNGEIFLKIVDKVTLSEIGLLAAAVGGACIVILVLLGIIVAVRLCRKKREHGIEMHPEEFEKGDPTVCSPADMAPLTVVKKEKAVLSSGDEPEPSSGGVEEEEEDALGDAKFGDVD